MKKLTVCGKEYEAGKIVKDGNEIRLYTDGKLELTFPNISNLDDFELEEGQEFDIEINEIAQMKISQAEQFETILEILGGMM